MTWTRGAFVGVALLSPACASQPPSVPPTGGGGDSLVGDGGAACCDGRGSDDFLGADALPGDPAGPSDARSGPDNFACSPVDCASGGLDCGTVPDGCGGTLHCGYCGVPDSCGGAGVANQCGHVTSAVASVSSTTVIPNWEVDRIDDGDPATCWSSQLHADADHEEWAVLDFGALELVEGLRVAFRSTQYSNIDLVPEHFVVQYTTADDDSWTDIPLHRYTAAYLTPPPNIPFPSSATDNDFTFYPIVVRKVRIKAEKLRDDGSGNYALQVCELAATLSTSSSTRFLTSLQDQLDADLNNYYALFSLARNQKNYRCACVAGSSTIGPVVGATATWGAAASGGESGFWIARKLAPDGAPYASSGVNSTTYQRFVFESFVRTPVTRALVGPGNWVVPPADASSMPDLDEGGIAWTTDSHVGHLGRVDKWMTENNAQYILSLWEYLRWSGDFTGMTEIGDRGLKVRHVSGSTAVFNDQFDYVHRLGDSHTIGQRVTLAQPTTEISVALYLRQGGVSNPRFQITVVDDMGQTVGDRTVDCGSDDCFSDCIDSPCNQRAWISVTRTDSMPFGMGSFEIELRNLGVNAPPDNLNYFLSQVGWLSSFTNQFGPTGDRLDQVALLNGVARTPLDNARIAMSYQLNEMHGANGILVMDAANYGGEIHQGERQYGNGGTNVPSSYWDVLRFGFESAWLNVFYYASLSAMANIEETVGDPLAAAMYRDFVMPTVRDSFNTEFWNPLTGRYASNVSASGESLDFGHTSINLMAIHWGLADPARVGSILAWLNGDRIVGSDTSVGSDIYAFAFGPRTNTLDLKAAGDGASNPTWWEAGARPCAPVPYVPGDSATWGWDVQSDGSGKADFGNWEQNGGARAFASYEDVLVRATHLGADNAWNRFRAVLDDYHRDGFYRESPGCWSRGYNAHLLASPEDGLPPVVLGPAFLGLQAQSDGLHIAPRLPSELTYAGVKNLAHWGDSYTIVADRSVSAPLVIEDAPNQYRVTLPANGSWVIRHGVAR